MSTANEALLWEALLSQFPLVKYLIVGLVSTCGAVTRHFWDSIRGVTGITFLGLLTYIVLGFFVGNLVGNFIDMDYAYRDGLLLLAGFTVKELLEIVQVRGAGLLSSVLKLNKSDSNKKEK